MANEDEKPATRNLHVGAFILLDFGKGHPHPPQAVPLPLSWGRLLSMHVPKFADGREIDSTSYIPKPNEKISVRGHGRFIYVGPQSLTRKGKINIAVEVYI